MLRTRVQLLALLVGILYLTHDVLAQDHRLIPTDDIAYRYIERLQRRGHLAALHPAALPYRYAEVQAALAALDREAMDPVARRWAELLVARLGITSGEGPSRLGAELYAGVNLSDSRRLDPMRPLGDTLHVYEHIGARVFLLHGPFVAQFGARHDLYYDRDPDGLDAVKRLMARGEDTYVGVHTPILSLYLGRFAHHWAPPGATALLLSDNPRSFDALSLRLGGERLSIRSLLGELDSITADGRYTGNAGDDSVRVGSERRFLAAHRFDWRPHENLALSIMESALYSGAGSSLSLKYLNPLLPFFIEVDNAPKNDENNGMIAGQIWLRLGRATLQGQLLIDDLDVLNAKEPSSFALAGTLVYVAAPRLDLGAWLDLVAARTYNTIQPEGRYLYLLRGLGTQFSDYIHTGLFADVYAAPSLTLTPRLQYLAQGERDIRQPFPRDDEGIGTILHGTVEHTLRASVEVFFQRAPWWWLRLDLGINHVRNRGAVAGRHSTRIAGMLSAGIRLHLDRPVRLNL